MCFRTEVQSACNENTDFNFTGTEFDLCLPIPVYPTKQVRPLQPSRKSPSPGKPSFRQSGGCYTD